MFVQTIKDLHKDVKETDYYLSKKGKMSDVAIDRFNLFITLITSGNYFKRDSHNPAKPTYISSKLLKDILGYREYKTIANTLEGLGYIKINHSYVSARSATTGNPARPKSYQLTQKALDKGIIKAGVLSLRMEEKMKALKRKKIDRYYQDQEVHQKILNSISEVTFCPHTKVAQEGLHKHPAYSDKDIFTRGKFEELERYNSYNGIEDFKNDSSFFYTQSINVGRVFHSITTIPSLFRKSLIHKDGSELMEIDLKNAQPLLLGLNYLQQKHKEGKKPSNSDKKLFNDLTKGNFYKRLSETANQSGDWETANKFISDYSEFKRLVLGEGLYFIYIPDQARVKPMEKHLINTYPDFMKWLRNEKRYHGYKHPSITAQTIESNIFIQQVFKALDGEFCIPVHDSIIVKKSQEDFFMSLLFSIFNLEFNGLPEAVIQELFHKTYFNYE